MITVTGASGANGTELLKLLSSHGVAARAMVRHPERADDIRLPHIEIVQGDFDRPETVRAALQGADKAFLLARLVAKRRGATKDVRQVRAAKRRAAPRQTVATGRRCRFVAAIFALSRRRRRRDSRFGFGLQEPRSFETFARDYAAAFK